MRDEVRILGVTVEYYLNRDKEFSASVGAEHFSDPTYDGLVAKIRASLQKQRVKVDVPVTILGARKYNGTSRFTKKYLGQCAVDGTLTGLAIARSRYRQHERDVTVTIIKPDDRFHYEVDTSFRGENRCCRRLTAAQKKQYVELTSQLAAAQKAYDDFIEKWKIDDPVEVVKAAIAAKIDDPKEPGDDENEGDPR